VKLAVWFIKRGKEGQIMMLKGLILNCLKEINRKELLSMHQYCYDYDEKLYIKFNL
jgi:hypothetical protein